MLILLKIISYNMMHLYDIVILVIYFLFYVYVYTKTEDTGNPQVV